MKGIYISSTLSSLLDDENSWTYETVHDVADDNFDFLENWEDTSTSLFPEEPDLIPALSELIYPARALLRFFVYNRLPSEKLESTSSS